MNFKVTGFFACDPKWANYYARKIFNILKPYLFWLKFKAKSIKSIFEWSFDQRFDLRFLHQECDLKKKKNFNADSFYNLHLHSGLIYEEKSYQTQFVATYQQSGKVLLQTVTSLSSDSEGLNFAKF